MKRIILLILISISMYGCGAYERGRAVTLEQKRDVLLKESPKYPPGYLTKDKVDLYTIRNELVASGGETQDFLKKLVDNCFDSSMYFCTFEQYYDAYDNFKKTREKNEKRKQQVAVSKGDLFYCKVDFHLPDRIIDSSKIRVGVKDNVDVVGFVFSNGYQIISPELKDIDSASGERSGMSPGGSLVVNASYDGSSYLIRLFDNHLDTEPSKDAIRYVLDLGSAGGIDIFDCKKA
ncbi:hypothetical protein SEZ80_003548 [Escherichia coli]|uniref:hypothetical protein n=1 Tax=Enterobacteriaceae TaxID=543 RepID=UPI0013A58B0B|nr:MULTISPECIES: hypothetical protein [Enterobacteriaceae]DAI94626.1 MAG TPA: hypothetical protein [Caudoviricetes sp.]EJV7846063.1 hypothetical protein [Escherichia coli]ELU9778458.1 hypothetical protein [Escherichia coli]EMB9049535.1 hypothetical protein [Escherichia coli]MDD9240721.1 hypothetical protein [Enterobacter roggenkampii]